MNAKFVYESLIFNRADYLKWKRQNVTIRGIQELGKENNGMASFGQGLYTAALGNRELARKYGKVYFVVGARPKHPIVVQNWNMAEIFLQNVVMNYGKEKGIYDYFDAKRDFDSKTNVRDEMLKLGYDGLVIKGREMVNYTPDENKIRYFENENQLIQYYEDFIANESVNEEFLLEGFNLREITSIFPSLSKLKRLNILASIFLMSAGINVSSANKEKIIQNTPKIFQLANKPNIEYKDITNLLSDYNFNKFKYNYDILKDANYFTASDSIKNFIKHHEKLRLVGYKLGDGKITIGYGHSEPKENSKFKEGQKISIDKAEYIFEKDIKICENGIKRLFNLWKSKGIDIKISQNMFDSMVSIAYNMGVNGLRSSDFVLLLKKGDYEGAGELILNAGVKNAESFPGLLSRREKEKNLFLEDLL